MSDGLLGMNGINNQPNRIKPVLNFIIVFPVSNGETGGKIVWIHPNFLGRVERGEEHISLTALRRIAKALHIRVRDLVVDI
ncbi:MAG: helix-turn-helix domain-containing protein [Limisphaerales bacterium]